MSCFALLSQFRASSPPPKKKMGCFILSDNKGHFFAINQKKRFNIFRFLTIHRAFPTSKQKANFCSLFCLKERSLMINISINKPLNATRTNGSRTVLKQKFSKLMFFQTGHVLMNHCCHSLDINAQVSGYPQTSTRNLSLSSRSNYLPAHIFVPDNLQTESLRSTVFYN